MSGNNRSHIAIKVFTGITGIASIVMAILVYLAWRALQAPTNAAEAATSYNSLSNPVFHINLYLFLFNLIFSVWMRAVYNRKFYFLIGLFAFIFFVNLDLFWLSEVYFHFKQQYKMWHGEFSLSGIVALLLGVFAAGLSVIGYLLGGWIHNRTLKKKMDV